MKKLRRLTMIVSLLAITALLYFLPAAWESNTNIPGLQEKERRLLRIWVTGSPGGAQAWLAQQLRAYEKQHPGLTTHLRIVSPEEVSSPGTVLPDVILHMPGDFTDPAALFTPATAQTILRPPLTDACVWQGEAYALPVCWSAWVLAVDSALEPGTEVTPAPTTLLGRPAATSPPTEPPGYPLKAASAAACALQSPGGAALMTLASLLPEDARPPLPADLAQLSPAEVFAAFQSHRCATAMLTTGQATALMSALSAGKGFPCRFIIPDTIITDQLWLASLTPDASEDAARLVAFLLTEEAQSELYSQGLYTVRDDLRLYAAGFPASVEVAAQQGLQAVNAYLPRTEAAAIAWQAFQGARSFADALASLV